MYTVYYMYVWLHSPESMQHTFKHTFTQQMSTTEVRVSYEYLKYRHLEDENTG